MCREAQVQARAGARLRRAAAATSAWSSSARAAACRWWRQPRARASARVTGLGDLSHASVVYSRDQHYAYVFGRDGGLTKVDLLRGAIEKRIVQAGNAIGGAISQDGKVVAVSNYEPGGVRLFDAGTLEPLAEIPAVGADGKRSKVVGLVDAPGHRFVFALYDAGEIWLVDARDPRRPAVRKFVNAGRQPYDGTVTSDGRFYVAGLFGEDGLALLDLWQPGQGVRKVLAGYGRGTQPLPVYKMPHLDYIAAAGDRLFVPAVGRHELLVIDARTWKERARLPTSPASRCSWWRARTDATCGSTSRRRTTTRCR